MLIRKATMADIDQLIPLYNGSLENMATLQPGQYRVVAQDREFVAKGVVEENADILIAEVDGKIAGLASVFLVERSPGPIRVPYHYVDLDTLYVLPEYQGQGIGSALFQAAMDWAKAHGAENMQLMTLGENCDAQKFYEKMNMKPLNIIYILDHLF